MATDTDVLIIGAGMSGLGLAVQLVRIFGTRNFELVEKTDRIGGTWHVNSYPGCGCDVPSHFYSYSFAPNPNWSQKFALQPEIQAYFDDVANKYNMPPHVRFGTELKTAVWDSDTATWVVQLMNLDTKTTYTRRCKILVSAVGGLSTPKDCDIPGAETFQGRMFHSAKWDHSFDYKDKDVVCIGNGCSATQFLPVLSTPGPTSVRSITQFSRQPHWLTPRPNPPYTLFFKFCLSYIPFFMRTYRLLLYLLQESDFRSLPLVSGSRLRQSLTQAAETYIRANAPDEYADALVPRTELGCKRRVMDTDYLLALHRPNVHLIHSDPIAAITPTGVRTASGAQVRADAIVLATGFETQTPLFPMTIRGEGGKDIRAHWEEVREGAPEAYFGTALAGFPNFWLLMGPNTLSGHLSVVFTSECQIGFVLRAIAPVLGYASGWERVLGWIGVGKVGKAGKAGPTSVAVTKEAEERDVAWVDEKAKGLVWASGCSSWFLDRKTGRNTVMYPDWQAKFWWRSLWVPRGDLVYDYKSAKEDVEKVHSREVERSVVLWMLVTTLFVGGVMLAADGASMKGWREVVGGA